MLRATAGATIGAWPPAVKGTAGSVANAAPQLSARVVSPTKESLTRSQIIVSFLLVSACHCGEERETRYARYEDAVQDGAIRRGWIPPFLPRSARSIIERHDIDTNETWIKFDFSETDRRSLRVAPDCVSISMAEAWFPRPVDWWPAALRAGTTSSEFVYFACEFLKPSNAHRGYLALSTKNPLAYYWGEGE